MLVLSRKSGEEVLVPQYGIILKILEIKGQQVRVGITAPPDVHLYRGEVWQRLQHSHGAGEVAAPKG